MDRVELELIDRRTESERRVTEHYTRLQRTHLESLRSAEREASTQRLTFSLALQTAQQRARAMRARTDIPAPQALTEYRQVLEQKATHTKKTEEALRSAESRVESTQRALSELEQRAKVHEARLECLETRRQIGIRQKDARREAGQGEELCSMVASKATQEATKHEMVRPETVRVVTGPRMGAPNDHPTRIPAALTARLAAGTDVVGASGARGGVNQPLHEPVRAAASRVEEGVDTHDGCIGAASVEGERAAEGFFPHAQDPTSLSAATTGERMSQRALPHQGIGRTPLGSSDESPRSNVRTTHRGSAAAGAGAQSTDVMSLSTPSETSAASRLQFGYRLQGGQIVRVELKKNEQGAIEVQLAPELFADRHLLARSLREVRSSMRQYGFKVLT